MVKTLSTNAGDAGDKMGTHSSILAWKSPWTEEPEGLQPKGSKRVGHDLEIEHSSEFSFIVKRSF